MSIEMQTIQDERRPFVKSGCLCLLGVVEVAGTLERLISDGEEKEITVGLAKVVLLISDYCTFATLNLKELWRQRLPHERGMLEILGSLGGHFLATLPDSGNDIERIRLGHQGVVDALRELLGYLDFVSYNHLDELPEDAVPAIALRVHRAELMNLKARVL